MPEWAADQVGRTLTVEIRLPVLDESGRRIVEEVLPAEPLGSGCFRLLASPGLVEGVAAGDELELVRADPAGYRILRRGGQLCIWVYVPEPPPNQTDPRLSRAAAALGGYLDGGNNNLRILTVPVSAGFPRVETEVNAAVAELRGSSWVYGNVYDRQNRPWAGGKFPPGRSKQSRAWVSLWRSLGVWCGAFQDPYDRRAG